MNDLEMIMKMFEMQEALDDAIYKAKGLRYVDIRSNYEYAILDEVGELNHELKKQWCWWKETQKKVDNEKVLEELVDVWHFVMGMFIQECIYKEENLHELIISCYPIFEKEDTIENSYFYMRQIVYQDVWVKFEYLVYLTESLDFTIQEVYEMYLKKNKENYDRLKRGY